VAGSRTRRDPAPTALPDVRISQRSRSRCGVTTCSDPAHQPARKRAPDGAVIILDALAGRGARLLTAASPYYGYARKERKLSPASDLGKLVANFITLAGAGPASPARPPMPRPSRASSTCRRPPVTAPHIADISRRSTCATSRSSPHAGGGRRAEAVANNTSPLRSAFGYKLRIERRMRWR